MNIQTYDFLAEKPVPDNVKLFYWFMTKIIEQTDASEQFTLAKYDLTVLLRGFTKGAYHEASVPAPVKEWFKIGFVTDSRVTISLTPKALNNFRTYDKRLACSRELMEITDPKVIAIHYYLLGVFTGADTMFYQDSFWGIGTHSDAEYHKKTKNLDRYEITGLLNGAPLDFT